MTTCGNICCWARLHEFYCCLWLNVMQNRAEIGYRHQPRKSRSQCWVQRFRRNTDTNPRHYINTFNDYKHLTFTAVDVTGVIQFIFNKTWSLLSILYKNYTDTNFVTNFQTMHHHSGAHTHRVQGTPQVIYFCYTLQKHTIYKGKGEKVLNMHAEMR